MTSLKKITDRENSSIAIILNVTITIVLYNFYHSECKLKKTKAHFFNKKPSIVA